MSIRSFKGALTPNQGYICLQCRLKKNVRKVGDAGRYYRTNSLLPSNSIHSLLVDKSNSFDLENNIKKHEHPSDARRESITARESNINLGTLQAFTQPNSSSLLLLQKKFAKQRQEIADQLPKSTLLELEDSQIQPLDESHYEPPISLSHCKHGTDKSPLDFPPRATENGEAIKYSLLTKDAPNFLLVALSETSYDSNKSTNEFSTNKLLGGNGHAEKIIDKASMVDGRERKGSVDALNSQAVFMKATQEKTNDQPELEGFGSKQQVKHQPMQSRRLRGKHVSIIKPKTASNRKAPQASEDSTGESAGIRVVGKNEDLEKSINKTLKAKPQSEIDALEIPLSTMVRVITKKDEKSQPSKASSAKAVKQQSKQSRRKIGNPGRNKLIRAIPYDPPLVTPFLSKLIIRKQAQGNLASEPKVLPVPLPLDKRYDIQKIKVKELKISAIERKQNPVPNLSHGLDRVLFNSGVHRLQDSRSRVFNFDPYLQTIMPVPEFDFNALNEYVTSSKDKSLQELAQFHGKRYVGSTSSMTGVLAHFHFLLSQWRDVNPEMVSSVFPDKMTSFTEIQRCPSAIFLRWKNGTYAIDADKEFASANILSMLGKSMEKLLTLDKSDFEKYRKSNSANSPAQKRNDPETFHYSTMGDFLMRAQLDAHDPRLPGTGMFDLKTRAVVSVRMDTQNYELGVGYQIKTDRGKFESFEREYYDMIRSAFLKYSLQVRMGRMDGIFVAFHNVERIFGFQYISLEEMDLALHGKSDTVIGDQEFKLSLDLLNKALEKATKKYPETSLRIHFETRDTKTPFMYIFAEPVTEAQVNEIQSTNEAKIAEFERKILGLHGKEGPSEEREPDEEGKWADIEASVEEAMQKDELSLTAPDASGEIISEVQQESSSPSEHEGLPYNESPAADLNGDDLAASSRPDDDQIDTEEEEAEEETEEEEVKVEVRIEEKEEEKDQEPGERSDEIDEDEVEEKMEDELERAKEGEDEFVEDGDEANHVIVNGFKEMDSAGSSQTLHNASISNEAGNSAEAPTQEDPSTANPIIDNLDSQKPIADGDFDDTKASETANSSSESSHDAPSSDIVNQEKPPMFKKGDMLAMTLTIRNRINGNYVLRPTALTAKDNWTVEYSLTEIDDPNRAWTLYKACQLRRAKKLEFSRKEEGDKIDPYLAHLRKISQQGAVWREKMDKEDEARPKIVWGQPVPHLPQKSDG